MRSSIRDNEDLDQEAHLLPWFRNEKKSSNTKLGPMMIAQNLPERRSWCHFPLLCMIKKRKSILQKSWCHFTIQRKSASIFSEEDLPIHFWIVIFYYSLMKIAYEKDDQSPLAFKIGTIHTLAQAVDQGRKVVKRVVWALRAFISKVPIINRWLVKYKQCM